MPDDSRPESELEIAHVLFADIVGYSKLPIERQSEFLRQLNQIVRNTEQFRAAETARKLVPLPTGDGMALAFFTSPEAPVRCATAIAQALQDHPELKLRMGIDSGPVDTVRDVNDRSNVAGGGINMAQRVMDCGDAGHILLSKRVAGDLAQYSKWQSRFHDLGEVEVKHGVKIGIVNFVEGDVGNASLPEKIRRLRHLQHTAVRRRQIGWAFGAILLAAVLGGAFWIQAHRTGPAPSIASASPVPALVPVPEKSIAVLPFENMSDAKEDAFFADGIQDDVLTSLGKIKELTVIGRNSVMSYRGAAAGGKLREIGKVLGVAHVLQGSVRRAANRVVVNVQLIDARDEHQRWSERYERTMTDALSLQGELAIEIARELRATLSPAEKSVVAAKPTENPEAYLLYLRAREIEMRNLFQPTEEEVAAAIKFYREAIEHDPKFALARARLSLRISFGTRDDAQRKEALAQAEEALRLNPNLGEARLALAGYGLWCQSEFEPALAELARAEELLPNSSEVWRMRAMIYKRQNKFRERIAALQHGETLDPRDTSSLALLAATFFAVRQWPDTIRTIDRIIALQPDDYQLQAWRAWGEFFMTGVLDPLKKIVAQPSAGTPPEELNLWRYQLAMLERDYPAAERFLRENPAKMLSHGFVENWKQMNEALLAVARGADATTVESALVAARKETEKLLNDDPTSFSPHSELGLIDAFRGRKEDAIREGRRGLELEDYSVLEKNGAAATLALIYARTGETDEAIKLIEKLLTLPRLPYPWFLSITHTDLKWNWVWDPLRDDPRFQKILEEPEPKTIY